MDNLKAIAFEIIDEEGLPVPKSIIFKQNLFGTIKGGSLTKYKRDNSYKITINLNRRKYIEDENGRYRDRVGTKRYRKAYGEERTLKETINIIGHEIAHLKFWNHDPTHYSYTQHLSSVIMEKLKRDGVDINAIGDNN